MQLLIVIEKFILLALFVVLFNSFSFSKSYAFSNFPSFPHCPNPGGNSVASYTDGWHAIVRNSQQQWGSDTVNAIGNNNFVQCFCPKPQNSQTTTNTNQGVQTNWLQANSISLKMKNYLLQNGWTDIANGTDFGLPNGEYLTYNQNYFCGMSSTIKNCNLSTEKMSFRDIHTSFNNEENIRNNLERDKDISLKNFQYRNSFDQREKDKKIFDNMYQTQRITLKSPHY